MKLVVKRVLLTVWVFVLAVLLLSCQKSLPQDADTQPSDTRSESLCDSTREWTPIYHIHEHGIMAQRALPKGSFEEELSQEQIALIVPDKQLQGVSYTGWVRFYADGTVYQAVVYARTQDKVVTIGINDHDYSTTCCISLEPYAKTSICGDVEYKIYQYDREKSKSGMMAKTVINNVPILVRMSTENFDADKIYFEAILEWLSWYAPKKPLMSDIVPANTPK